MQAQREPVDARILLEAAIAARQPLRAQPVLEHLRDTGLLDVQLQRLVTQLQEVSP